MALIQQSSHCRQLIEYECFSAPLEFNGVQYSWWNDRHGHPQYFWSGSKGHEHRCHCDTHGQCFDPSVRCNCDSIAPTELKDSGKPLIPFILIYELKSFKWSNHQQGYITNKSLLPITRVNFGRLLTALSSGHYRLGRLECTGFVAFEGMPGSCEDLKRIGHQFSGFYTVKVNSKVQTIYCDMSKLPGDEGNWFKWMLTQFN